MTEKQMENEIEIIDFQTEGYAPLVDYDKWRVAVLKFCDDLRIEKVTTMQKHLESDEVFVLMQGECTLFLGGRGEKPAELRHIKMELHKVYNIKKGEWHNHMMNEAGEVLIVENRNTSDDNSPIVSLTEEQIKELRKLV